VSRGRAEDGDLSLSILIERWRERLARDIALSSPQKTTREISAAVHGLILRIVSLAYLEGSGILAEGDIRACAVDGRAGLLLGTLFSRVETDYGLFSPAAADRGNLGASWHVSILSDADSRTLIDILAGISPLLSFFRDADALVTKLPVIYDRFLSRDIRRHGGALVKIEETPAAAHAGGKLPVPAALASYVIRKCVEEVISGKSPGQTAGFRILDPACGSGRFLLAAYEALTRHHEAWYRDRLVPLLDAGHPLSCEGMREILPHGEGNEQLPVTRAPSGDWILTGAECRRILATHLFGLDPDPRAAEAAQVFLRLAVLECSRPGLPGSGFPGAANVLCGSVLFAPDLFLLPEMMLVPEQIRAEIRAVDWKTEFPGPAREGGFSLVIGNPPATLRPPLKGQQEYLQMHYRVYHGREDAVPYFIERGLSLLNTGGCLAFIVPDRWLRAGYAAPLRELLRNIRIVEIARVPGSEGTAGAGSPCVLLLANLPPAASFRVVDITAAFSDTAEEPRNFPARRHAAASLRDRGWTLEDTRMETILAKLRAAGRPLSESVRGTLSTGSPAGRPGARYPGDMITRYGPVPPPRHPHGTSGARHVLHARSGRYGRHHMAIPTGGQPGGRILIFPSAPRISCTFDRSGNHTYPQVIEVPTRNLVLLGILNSRLFSFALALLRDKRDEKPEMYSPDEIARTPVYTIDLESGHGREQHEKMVYYVRRMLELHEMMKAAGGEPELRGLERQIAATDREIDRLVYELFGLSGAETEFVEEYLEK
jgi:hypothetical protein